MKKLLEDKKVILEIPKYDDELYIIGDYDRLKQVFINLKAEIDTIISLFGDE